MPLKKEDKIFLENQKKEMEKAPPVDLKSLSPMDLKLELIKKKQQGRIMVNKKNPDLKQILHGQTGYARPGELLAIMGASGSGKTSLLNILGQRLDVSKGANVEGQIKCNGISVSQGDFGKLGAFVM